MKKIATTLLVLTIMFIGINKIYSQNVLVSGAGTALANGIYISSDPDIYDGQYYYTKAGSPQMYIYWRDFFGIWNISPELGGAPTDQIFYTSATLLTSNWGVLHGQAPAPTTADTHLPVELSSFTVETTSQGAICKWTTESETENLGFILERCSDGSDWTDIANYKTDSSLEGQGSTSSATDYEYLDKLVEPKTTYEYRLGDVDYDGIVTYHSVRKVAVEQAPLASIIEEFTVLPAYPNPFNPSTTIMYGLDTKSKVSVQIFDLTGQLISTIINTEQSQGWHSVVWNGTNQKDTQVPTGIYLSKVTSGNEVKTTKLMLLK